MPARAPLNVGARPALSALSCALATAGCGGPTAVIVEVDSDLSVPDQLDTVRIRGDVSGQVREANADLRARGLPRRLELRPQADSLGPYTVSVEGLLNRAVVVQVQRSISFVSGNAMTERVVLQASCAGVSCPMGQECQAGQCVVVGRDAGMPDGGGGADASTNDAGTAPDAGATCPMGCQCTEICGPSGCTCDQCPCNYTCESGQRCDATCRNFGDCRVVTNGATGGVMTCQSGADCNFRLRQQGSYRADCNGGSSCRVVARNVDSATGSCRGNGTQCDYHCVNTTSCSFECRMGASCRLVCGDAVDTCEYSRCMGGTGEASCPDGSIVGNRACP